MFRSKKLKKYKDVKHYFFSRKGGFSKGYYKSLNCGRGSNDKKTNIIKNLNFISKKLMVKKSRLILMHQTHSNKVVELKINNYKKKIFSDAMITKIKGLALGVVTADCVPILIYERKNKIVGCIHAGWRGAFSGIVKNTISKMRELCDENDIYASIGPCISKFNYEVDSRFFKKFLLQSRKNKRYFKKKNSSKKLFDLRKFVADKLLEQKVKIDHVNHDTFADKNNFFSYRRSLILKQKDYGRCISVIKLN